MSFAVVKVPTGGISERMPEGVASLRAGGMLVAHASDLAVLGITDKVVTLSDPDTQRVAIRAPRDGETEIVNVGVMKIGKKKAKRDSGLRSINVRHALRAAGFADTNDVRGRYEPITLEDLFIVAVGSGPMDGGKKHPQRGKRIGARAK